MQATPQTGAEIQSVLDKFCAGYGKKDIDALLSLFDADPDVLVIGTGEDEKRTGLEEIRIQFERDFANPSSSPWISKIFPYRKKMKFAG